MRNTVPLSPWEVSGHEFTVTYMLMPGMKYRTFVLLAL